MRGSWSAFGGKWAADPTVAEIDRDQLGYRQLRLLELCVDEGRTLEEAGRIFNITRERARQILKQMGVELRAVRAASRANGGPPRQLDGDAEWTAASGLDPGMRTGIDCQGGFEAVRARIVSEVPELMGAAEVAEALGVKASNLQFIHDMPESVQRLRATRIWRAQDILNLQSCIGAGAPRESAARRWWSREPEYLPRNELES